VPADGAELVATDRNDDSNVPSVDGHMNIVRALVELERAGGGRQAQRRALERQVRQRALELADRLNDRAFVLTRQRDV
jgi:hypothetical protein